jgi:hypothetical protein
VLVAGWVQQQAEVAVRHPAGLQDLAVGVGAELCTGPLLVLVDGWGTRLPGPTTAFDPNQHVAQRTRRRVATNHADGPLGAANRSDSLRRGDDQRRVDDLKGA